MLYNSAITVLSFAYKVEEVLLFIHLVCSMQFHVSQSTITRDRRSV